MLDAEAQSSVKSIKIDAKELGFMGKVPSKKSKEGQSSSEESIRDERMMSSESVELEESDDLEEAPSKEQPQASATEMSASFKNFRHHPDMENFYRFIHENDLRVEALEILNQMLVQKQSKRKK